MLSPEQRTATLQSLARRIAGAGLVTPVAVVLDALQPVDLLSAQLMLFLRPFVVGDGLSRCAEALAQEDGWQELRRLLRLLEGSERGK